MMNVFLVLFLIKFLINCVSGNDFSSFLTANASLAVVVDHEYMQKRNEDILAQVQKVVEDIVRENLRNGGLNIKYFAWSAIRLKKEFIAAITVTDCKRTWTFFEASNLNSVLLMAITEADCPRLPIDQAIMIPIIDRGEEIPQLLLDVKVQQVLNWKSCVLLFDSSIESKTTQVISSLVHESPKNMFKPISLYLYKINEGEKRLQKRESIRNALRKFTRNRDNRFIVFSSSIEDVMEIAADLKMFHVFNQWLFFLPITTDRVNTLSLTQGLNEGANIAFAVNDTIVGCQETVLCSITELVHGFVAALSKVIREEVNLYGQISDEEWESIRLTKKERQDEILEYIKEYLHKNNKCSACSKWSFKSMESWGRSRQYTTNIQRIETTSNFEYDYIDVGYWSPMFGFISNDVLFPHTDHKFRNITLNILTYNNPPWQILTRNSQGDVTEATGIVMEILKALSDKLNFTYKLQEYRGADDGYFIESNENGNFTELAGTLTNYIPPKLVEMLTKNNFFMAAIGATVNDPDFVPFNYTIPVSVQSYTFISRRPDEVSRIYLFTAPFSLSTWACLVAAIIIIAPLLYLINKFNPSNKLKTPGLYKMKNCFWYIYGALLQQGGMYLPKADSGRVIIGVWWIVVIILVTTYCGNLVAFLTFPKFQPGINYLHEIFKHKNVHTFGLRNGTFFEKYTTHTTRADFKRFMNKVTFYNSLSSEEIGAVQSGQRINIDWRINLQLSIQRDFEKTKQCNFILGKEDFVDEQISLILPLGSPYLDVINDEIKRLHQMGFMERWHKIFLPLESKCNGKGKSRQITNHMVNLNDMQGCFLVLVFGFLFSAFIIIMEFGIHRFLLLRKKKMNNFVE